MELPTLSCSQIRRLDQLAIEKYGIAGVVLMENAGRGATDCLCGLSDSGPIVICCGKGNNAGDGFVIARHLELRGYQPKVMLWADPNKLLGDAGINFRILEKTDVPIEQFHTTHDHDRLAKHLVDATWIVDALLGTGVKGSPRSPLDAVIDQINSSSTPCLAVDIPSGLNCDTGKPTDHTIRANHTCTFAAPKSGFLSPVAEKYTGKLHVVDIGTPRKLIDEILNNH